MWEYIAGSLIIVFNILIVLKLFIFKGSSDIKKEMTDLRFYQQTQFMNIGKSLSDDFGKLRESIIQNISRYNEETVKEYMDFNYKINNELFVFKENILKDLFNQFEKLNKNLNDNLDRINVKVESRLNEGFAKTTETFNSILERISKIDEAQKKIESLSTNIISLQDILTDKKSRGTFGELQLKQILTAIFGDNNVKVYELQRKLSNDKIADAMLYTPQPLGNICIDSKFPLENYKRLSDRNENRDEAVKQFKQDVKNHIDDIHDKYIIPIETADSAIMFVPAEAVFAEINAYHPDLIEYAQKRNVWIASPTTLMFLLTTVQVILRNIERDKYSALIHDELNHLGFEFKRYKERWDKLSRNIDQVSKNVKELHTTSDKIEKHFDSISKVDLKGNINKLEYDDSNEEEKDESSN